MTVPAVREAAARVRDTRRRLAEDIDAWVATTQPDGTPYLLPLSFYWDGTQAWLATRRTNPTARNMLRTGVVRLALGHPRDVVLIDGTVRLVEPAELTASVGDAFAAKTRFDPRRLARSYGYFSVLPDTIQAWREVDEYPGRVILADGRWTTGPG